MDLVTGLSALSQAIGIAKDLKELERGVDQAEFKLKLADLTSALADAKVALSDANLALNERETLIADLREQLDKASNGEICPKCRAGRLQLVDTRAEPRMGLKDFGVENWTFECDNPDCSFVQKRKHDPHGVLPGIARGK